MSKHGGDTDSKTCVGQAPAQTWLTYQDAHGKVVYGGKPLGPAPQSVTVRP